MKKSFLFLFIFSTLVVYGQNQYRGTIKVIVYGLRNNTGQVGIRIFDKSDGFPTKPEKAIEEIFVKPTNGQATFEITNWKYGTYAIGSIHDENSNKEIDKNFFGIPKEGFGTSNNPKIVFGPPSFKEASFAFNDTEIVIKIKMVYF